MVCGANYKMNVAEAYNSMDTKLQYSEAIKDE